MQRTVHTLAEIDPLLERVRAAAKRTTRAIGELRTSRHHAEPDAERHGKERPDRLYFEFALRRRVWV